MSESSVVLSRKPKCEIVLGIREGEWLRLFCESGHVLMRSGSTVFIEERQARYEKIVQGTCADVSKLPITNIDVCEAAAASLGLQDATADRVVDTSATSGCYWSEVSEGAWQLLLVHNPGPQAAPIGSPSVQPICASRVESCVPATTTTTTATATATSSTSSATTTSSVTTSATTTQSTTTQTTTTSTGTMVPVGSSKYPSLLCFSMVRTVGYEPALVAAQHDRQASIFACNDYLLYSNGGVFTVGPITSTEIAAPVIGMGNMDVPGETTNSWLNTLLFMKAWELLIADRRFEIHDWVVKVDPDAVFFPERLRTQMEPHTTRPQSTPQFVANCDRIFGPDEVFHTKVFGAMEIFSQGAIKAYETAGEQCKQELTWQGWGEDYYMQSCMGLLHVAELDEVALLSDNRCVPGPCTDATKAAFHDFKDVGAWAYCWQESLGPEGVKAHMEEFPVAFLH